MENFRRSGMGDCPDESVLKERSLRVYSSNFYRFCDRKPIVLYCYELLVREDNLLGSVLTEMPAGTGHNSDTVRDAAPVREHKRAKKGNSSSPSEFESAASAIVAALKAPIPHAQPPTHQHPFDNQWSHAKMRYDALRSKSELRSALEREYETNLEKLARYSSMGIEVPEYFKQKEVQLLKELEDLQEESTKAHPAGNVHNSMASAGSSSMNISQSSPISLFSPASASSSSARDNVMTLHDLADHANATDVDAEASVDDSLC